MPRPYGAVCKHRIIAPHKRRHNPFRSAQVHTPPCRAMSTHPHHTRPESLARTMLNKVPEVTLFFWVIKIMCTTVGETAADYLNDNLGFGLTNTTYVAGALLVALLVVQFRLRRYVPGIYWSVVVVISVFGTLITDNLTDRYNVPLTTSTIVFASSSRSSSRSGGASSARSRSTRSSPPAARPSTGWRSCSRSRSAPPPATWSPRSSASATASRSRSSAALIAADHLRPLRAQAQRRPGVLARLHPDPAARRLDRRLHVPAQPQVRRARPRHHRHELHLPRRASSRWWCSSRSPSATRRPRRDRARRRGHPSPAGARARPQGPEPRASSSGSSAAGPGHRTARAGRGRRGGSRKT